jgi:hypothetical protein
MKILRRIGVLWKINGSHTLLSYGGREEVRRRIRDVMSAWFPEKQSSFLQFY